MEDKAEKRDKLVNLEAESALLGSLLIENTLVDKVSDIVAMTDFFAPVHGRIYRAILRLYANNEIASPVSLRPLFEDDDALQDVGGAAYLSKLTGNSAVLIGTVDYAKQIAEFSRLRKAREAMQAALARLEDMEQMPKIGEIQGDLEAKLWAAQDNTEAKKLRAPEEIVWSTIERVKRGQTKVVGACNKFITDIDKLLGPLEPGTFNLLAARPAMGKTATAVSLAYGYAANAHPSLYLHAEMTGEQMDMRSTANLAFAMNAGLTHEKLRSGDLTPAELRKLQELAVASKTLPIDFYETGRCDITKLDSIVGRACAKWEAMGRKLEVVFVDYIQRYSTKSMIGAKDTDPRLKTNAVSEFLVALAQRREVAVFALSQLSRKCEERPDKTPQIADLRESGQLEEDADSVTLLYRHEVYLEREKPTKPGKEMDEWDLEMQACRGKIDLIVPKNRHGRPGKRTGNFYGDYIAVRGGDMGHYDPLFDNQEPLI